jgi:signal peptidase I
MRPAVRAASTSAVVALVLAAVWLFWPSGLGGGTTYVVTHGTSMEPGFSTGDLAVLRPASEYAVGDVVAYDSPTLETIVMHRIVAVDGDRFVLQGDDNDWLDEDRPTGAEILGGLFLRVPRGGEALDVLASPGALALILGTGLAVMVGTGRPTGGRTPRRAPRHRARTHRLPVTMPTAMPMTMPTRARARQVALAAGVVAFLAGGALALLVALPSTEPGTRTVQVAQRSEFSYSGAAERGTTYPTGTIATGDPIYTRLTDELLVTFATTVSAEGLEAVGGSAWLDLAVTTPDGWTAALGRGATGTVENGTVTVSTTVDPSRAAAFLAQHFAEIGTSGGSASLVVTPTVELAGTVQGRPFTAGAPEPLSLTMDASSLNVSGGQAALTPSAQIPVDVGTVEQRTIALAGFEIPVGAVRLAAGVVLALALVVVAVAGWIGRPRRDDVADAFLVRHAARILPVAQFTPGRTVVDVADAEALGRVAVRIDGLVLHQAGPDGQTLAVQDSDVTYRYVFPAELVPPRPGRPEVPRPAAADATRPLARVA